MAGWIVTITAIALLSVLCDVILPDGSTKKYAKTVFGIVVTLVIVQSAANVWKDFSSAEELQAQQTYVKSVEERSCGQKNEQLVSALKLMGFDAVVRQEGEMIFVEVCGETDEQDKAKIKNAVRSVFGKDKAVGVQNLSVDKREQ